MPAVSRGGGERALASLACRERGEEGVGERRDSSMGTQPERQAVKNRGFRSWEPTGGCALQCTQLPSLLVGTSRCMNPFDATRLQLSYWNCAFRSLRLTTGSGIMMMAT